MEYFLLMIFRGTMNVLLSYAFELRTKELSHMQELNYLTLYVVCFRLKKLSTFLATAHLLENNHVQELVLLLMLATIHVSCGRNIPDYKPSPHIRSDGRLRSNQQLLEREGNPNEQSYIVGYGYNECGGKPNCKSLSFRYVLHETPSGPNPLGTSFPSSESSSPIAAK
ncbi:hypothetical protein O6H91_17G032800 [Diphasiastrum complanatum]|uniref:Uncharacterized protein n=1 Tax=Diphasiastrum complanatum TaxID=34168 RepID=A0ACC2B5I8_DIPCM|nr:hypothetical protein O6H91_17G032800 [Diphasiastrum complanatum]